MSLASEHRAQLVRYGFNAARAIMQPADSMADFVRRDEFAMHLMERGRVRVLFASGDEVVMHPSQLVLSWGGFPHRAVCLDADSRIGCVTIPMSWVTAWRLPSTFVEELLSGQVIVATRSDGGHDQRLLNQWIADISSQDGERTKISLLEIQARLQRLALEHKPLNPQQNGTDANASQRLPNLLRFVHQNRGRAIEVSDLAREAGVHPAYLSKLFKEELGLGPAQYLAQCRVAHAKGMLLSTSMTVNDIAVAAGFGSVSQFHAVFRRHCGCSPRAYAKGQR